MGQNHAKEMIARAAAAETHFSRQEIISLVNQFRDLAATSPETPDVINESQFHAVLQQLGLEPRSKQVAFQLFKAFDRTHNGNINFREFCSGLSVLLRGTLSERWELLFRVYDVYEDGFVTRDEMKLILSAAYLVTDHSSAQEEVQQSAVLNDEELNGFVERIFNEADLSQDGRLSQGEFVRALQLHPEIASVLDF